MRLPRFTYFEPRSLEEALALLSSQEDFVVKAGGTDLIPRLKWKLAKPEAVINIKGLSDLNFIREGDDGGLHIGALTPLREIEISSIVKAHFGALTDAVAQIASMEIRNIGTLGGNIFYNQSPLFRKATDPCLKAGGSKCYIAGKGNQCYGLFCADTVPLLMAADAKLRIVSSNNDRLIDIQDFYTGDGKSPFTLKKDELLTEIHIPRDAKKASAVYLKYRFREAMDFPIAGIAVLGGNGKKNRKPGQIRIVVGGTTSRPSRCFKAESILATGEIDDKALQKACKTAADETKIVSSSGCSVSHKKTIVEELVIRGVRKVLS